MSKITDLSDAIFSRDVKKWNSISDVDKDKFSFIFNRYFSKKYIRYSQLLNLKSQDNVSLMNLWFYFIKDNTFDSKWDLSKWFWSKTTKDKNDSKLDYKKLMIHFDINKKEDIDYLVSRYPDLVKSELKIIKDVKQ